MTGFSAQQKTQIPKTPIQYHESNSVCEYNKLYYIICYIVLKRASYEGKPVKKDHLM